MLIITIRCNCTSGDVNDPANEPETEQMTTSPAEVPTKEGLPPAQSTNQEGPVVGDTGDKEVEQSAHEGNIPEKAGQLGDDQGALHQEGENAGGSNKDGDAAEESQLNAPA